MSNRSFGVTLWLAAMTLASAFALPQSGMAARPAIPPSPPSPAERLEFEAKMLSIPLPKHGCFIADFGAPKWREIRCGKAPKSPNPMAKGSTPNYVGAGHDFFSQSGGLISSATGSFDSVSNVTALSGPTYLTPTVAHTNVYSLQMNANDFATSACQGSVGCSGWEQFLYSQTQCNGACIFIEYWLLNHNSSCPAGQGWYYWNGAGGTVPGCYLNTAFATVPVQPLSALAGLRLTGKVAGGTDTVSLSVQSGSIYAASNASIAGLGQGWKSVEYNLVGDCCAYGTYFTVGPATLNVRVRTVDGTQNAPTCLTSASGATAETNNLDLVGSCAATGGSQPSIAFSESGGGPLPPGISQGDTHLITIGGAHYDFQEAGEFILAQAGTDLTVQARQDFLNGNNSVSWNTAVAIQMGQDQIVIYPTGDPVIKLRPTPLADGGSLTLDAGVVVSRQANLYTVSRPGGDTIQASTWNDHIDLNVRLGATEAPQAHGLLISQSGVLATRTGQSLRGILTRESFRGYVESWRVNPAHSLFPAKGRPGSISASRGPPPSREKQNDARVVCTAMGVQNATLLQDCILDVAVSGNSHLAEHYRFTPKPKRGVIVRQQ